MRSQPNCFEVVVVVVVIVVVVVVVVVDVVVIYVAPFKSEMLLLTFICLYFK